jgi:hypothetical protein
MLTVEALAGLHEGERLLDELPPLHPDHETVRLVMIDLLRLYEAMTVRREETHLVLATNAATIASARAVLDEVRARVEASTTKLA